MAGVTAAKIDSNTPHIRRKHRRAKSGSKIESNGDGNGEWQSQDLIKLSSLITMVLSTRRF